MKSVGLFLVLLAYPVGYSSSDLYAGKDNPLVQLGVEHVLKNIDYPNGFFIRPYRLTLDNASWMMKPPVHSW